MSVCYLNFLGQDDLAKIAAIDGEPLPDEDDYDIEEDTEEEHKHYELASKFLRFFTHYDNDFFYVFIECGVKRDFTVRPVFERTQIELSITIPKPEDDLFHFVGISKATEVDIEDTEELIYIEPPRKLSPKKEEKLFYPNNEIPLYVIFKYEMEIPTDDPEIPVHIDLTKKFQEISNQKKKETQ